MSSLNPGRWLTRACDFCLRMTSDRFCAQARIPHHRAGTDVSGSEEGSPGMKGV